MSHHVSIEELEAVARGLHIMEGYKGSGDGDETKAADIIGDVLTTFPTHRWERILSKATADAYGDRYGIVEADGVEVLLVGAPEADESAEPGREAA